MRELERETVTQRKLIGWNFALSAIFLRTGRGFRLNAASGPPLT